MIGVANGNDERETVEEFFQLFKTPWEYYRPRGKYRVLLCTTECAIPPSCDLVLIFDPAQQKFDLEHGIEVGSLGPGGMVSDALGEMPLTGEKSRLGGPGWAPVLELAGTGEPLAVRKQIEGTTFIRAGFGLFQEIRHLLTSGQETEHSLIPTVDRLISTVRGWILGAGIPVCEIPPIPAGYSFIGCMTHDVDFLRFRDHFMDRTYLGFLHRIFIATPIKWVRGKVPFRILVKNILAGLASPLVHLRLLGDFWDLADRYADIEKDVVSTFFIIPFKGQPGQNPAGPPDSRRKVGYGAGDLGNYLEKSLERGCEAAVHGIDAWSSKESGERELSAVAGATGARITGMRTHWLYFSREAFQHLEDAGYEYDSSMGYNGAVGFRCGTVQAFRPPDVRKLMEIPLNIMDTSLFYPAHMNLDNREAMDSVQKVLASYRAFGGVLTVNWHHRSIGPERYWDDFYRQLLATLKSEGAWFATAEKTCRWFRKRRQSSLTEVRISDDELRIRGDVDDDPSLPGLTLRVYLPPGRNFGVSRSVEEGSNAVRDLPVKGRFDVAMPLAGAKG